MKGGKQISPALAGVIIVVVLAVIGFVGFKAISGRQAGGVPPDRVKQMHDMMMNSGGKGALPTRVPPGMPAGR